MKPDAADNSVPREISALLSNQRLILRETQRAVTPLGGVAVFVAFLHKLGFVEKLRQHMPIQLKSPNHIDPTATFTAFLIAVLAGARRFAHTNWLRGDRALHALLGLSRFPIDDTIRNLFRRFGMGDVHRLFDPLAEWQMERLPQRSGGYSLDLDSTVFERYGNQQGSLKGHNPRKHGRPVIIPCWRCWPKPTSCSTAGSAAATAEQHVESWSFSKKPSRSGDSAR